MTTIGLPADGGFARIWRFTSGVLPAGTVCQFDGKMNILTIDREEFDKLDDDQQRAVWRTTAPEIRSI